MPGRDETKDQPDDDQQRRTGSQEIRESIVAGCHDQQIGLVADGRGEGTVSREHHSDGEGLNWQRQAGGNPHRDGGEQYRRCLGADDIGQHRHQQEENGQDNRR